MTLYHIHRVYNHDNLYRPGSTIMVDSKFENNIYKKVNNSGSNIPIEDLVLFNPKPGEPDYKTLFAEVTRYRQSNNIPPFMDTQINLGEFIELAYQAIEQYLINSKLKTNMPRIPYESLPKLLKDLTKYLTKNGDTTLVQKLNSERFIEDVQWMAYQPDDNKKMSDEIPKLLKASCEVVKQEEEVLNELAIEQARLKRFPNKPSRLNTMFACQDSAIDYWVREMGVKNANVYEIETEIPEQDQFRTNAKCIKFSGETFMQKVTAAEKYFSPSTYSRDDTKDEYLLTGKVTLGEVVKQIRR